MEVRVTTGENIVDDNDAAGGVRRVDADVVEELDADDFA